MRDHLFRFAVCFITKYKYLVDYYNYISLFLLEK